MKDVKDEEEKMIGIGICTAKRDCIGGRIEIRDLDVPNIFCYFNNDYEANATKNSQQLKEMLSEAQSV